MKQGWEIKRLSEIGKVYNGNSINEKVKKDNYADLEDGIPFIATKDISYESEIDYDNGIKIPFAEKSSFKTASKNTVLICAEGGSAGRKIGFTNQEVCFGNKLFALATNKNIESRYVYYYYFSATFQKDFAVELAGIIGGVSMNKFKDLEIPLPPLPEQQRIVSILDEAFAAIAKAKANAEQNLKNAKELFESYLQGVFENKGDGWEEKTFEDVCNLVGGSQPSKDDFIYEPKEGYIRLIQVRDYRTSKYITYIPKDKARRFCSENDIMIGRYGPPIFGIFKGLEGAYNVALMKAEVNTKICNSDYFFWFLKTNKLRVFVENSSKRAAGQDGIRKELLDKYPVPLPKSLKTQQSIVHKLEALSTEAKKLEAIYQIKINDLEELKKSVLQKAFNGELNNKILTK